MPVADLNLTVGDAMFLLGGFIGAAFRKLDLHAGRLRRPKPFVRTPRQHHATAQWIVRYTNQARARHNLPGLKRYLALQSAAQGHSNWMAQTKAFSHFGHHGVTAHARMAAAGYPGGMTGENIYKYPSRRDRKRLAKDLVDGWMKSPGHRTNILKREYNYIGVGVASSGGEVYATQNFGR